jgi:uncharacterized membrane protein
MRIRFYVGILLLLMGLVWVGQGIGLIGGSFMSDDLAWAVIGALTAGIGAVLAYWGWRKDRSAG